MGESTGSGKESALAQSSTPSPPSPPRGTEGKPQQTTPCERKPWHLSSKCGGAFCLGPFDWKGDRKSGLFPVLLMHSSGCSWSEVCVCQSCLMNSSFSPPHMPGWPGAREDLAVRCWRSRTTHSCPSSAQENADLFCSLHLEWYLSSNLSPWLDSMEVWIRIWKWLRHGREGVDPSTLLPVLVPSTTTHV